MLDEKSTIEYLRQAKTGCLPCNADDLRYKTDDKVNENASVN